MVTVRLLQQYYLFFLYAGIQSHQRNIRSTYRISDFSKFIINIHAACWPNLTTSAKHQLHNRTCCSVLSCNISNSVSPVLLQFYILSKKNGKKYVALDFIQSSHSFNPFIQNTEEFSLQKKYLPRIHILSYNGFWQINKYILRTTKWKRMEMPEI